MQCHFCVISTLRGQLKAYLLWLYISPSSDQAMQVFASLVVGATFATYFGSGRPSVLNGSRDMNLVLVEDSPKAIERAKDEQLTINPLYEVDTDPVDTPTRCQKSYNQPDSAWQPLSCNLM